MDHNDKAIGLGRYRYAVYGYPHVAFDTVLLGRYRFRLIARIAAWWFKCVELDPTAHTWVREEDVTVNV